MAKLELLKPVWDLISTLNLGAPACKACQMLWVISYPVHYSHFQEKKVFLKKKKKKWNTHTASVCTTRHAARKDVTQLCLLCVMSEEVCSQANCIISVHRQNSQMNKLINENNLNQKQTMLKRDTHTDTHTQSGCTIDACSYKPATLELMQNEELCSIGVAINYQAAPIGMKQNFN